ncbi:MAG: hypothetical protein KF724_01330 [Phycisphaeraceae bacterium]|nr:hypothetical protein [Phycisphaeraceae bacterium]
MQQAGAKPNLRLTAAAARQALRTHRDRQKYLLEVAFALLGLVVAAAIGIMFTFGAGSKFNMGWIFAFLIMPVTAGSVLLLASRALGRQRNRLALRLVRHGGRLCLECQSPLPKATASGVRMRKPCCDESLDQLEGGILIETWLAGLAGVDRSFAVNPSTPFMSKPTLLGLPRRIALQMLGGLAIVVMFPLLLGTLAVVSSSAPFSFESLLIEVIASLRISVIFVLVLVGSNLISVGLGRRIDRGQFCASCGYRWKPRSAPRCPECGASWNRPGQRTLGRPERNPWLTLVGFVVLSLSVWAMFWTSLSSGPRLVPTGLLLRQAEFGAVYCPRVDALAERTLTPEERREFSLRSIEAFEALLSERTRGTDPHKFNLRGITWLEAELAGAHGPTDPALLARARSLIAPLAATIKDQELILEGDGLHTPLSIRPGATLLLAVERPEFMPLAPGAGFKPSRLWGDPIDGAGVPVNLARSGTALSYSVDRNWDWRRITVRLDRPSAPGRYLVTVRHWVIVEPGHETRVNLNDQGAIAPRVGGWAERYEHRLLLEVPADR